MKKVLITIIVIVITLCVFSVVTGHITNSRIQKRTTYWKSLIDAEIPTGTTKEKIEQWGKQRGLHLTWIPDRNFFDANVEQVPESGIGFPCSEWNIIVDIYIGKDNASVKGEVSTVGSCV